MSTPLDFDHDFGLDRHYAVERRDVPYLRHGSDELLARVWQPVDALSVPRRAIIDVHGGAWCDHDRRAGKRYNARLAAAGAVVVAIDFRCGASGPHPSGSTDVGSALQWVTLNSDALGVDPRAIACVGSSSGGHLAWLAAIAPADIEPARCGQLCVEGRWVAPPVETPHVAGVGAFWPPLDPLTRYRYARELGDDHGERLVANTISYFGNEQAMGHASIADVVERGAATRWPPVLLVVPEHDRNVPPAITDRVAETWAQHGGAIEVRHYPGVGHSFGHFDTPQSDRFDRDLIAWLTTLPPA